MTMNDSPSLWRKSTHSGNGGNCTEVATHQGHVLIRDSKHPEAPHIRLRPQTFARLIAVLRATPNA